jgi:XTP/dITP diphosphohydrolase
MELVIASTNVHKIREFRSLLKPLVEKKLLQDVLSLLDFPNYIPPPETGSTFEENALLKATHAAKALKKWSLADDSGLVVPALHGQPGVFSARYAGEHATDRENRKKLLSEMSLLQDTARDAYFECAIAIASPEGFQRVEKGVCEGTILEEERGGNGFSYDSIFRKHDYSKTFAELDESIKNRVSHRRKAFDRILFLLESLLSTQEEHALLD